MKKIIYIIAIFSVFIISCEKTVNNVNIPNNVPKLVCQSFISADQPIIKLYLSWSNPIFNIINNSGFKWEKDAKVIISNGSKQVQLTYFEDIYNMQYYYWATTSDLNIQPNDELKLEVTTQSGKLISSQTIIPESPNISVKIDKIDSIVDKMGFSGYSYTYAISITGNNSNSSNYYYFGAIGYTSLYGLDSLQLYEKSAYNSTYYKYQNGESKIITFTNYLPVDSIRLIVLNTDASYYLYHKSVNNFDGGNNPFAEPVIIYSNIDNGLGVFCSYSQVQTMIKIKP